MKKRLAYMIPEFPGQTHIFFWREIARLEALNVDLAIVSTRPPPPSIRSHTWSVEAKNRTLYLFEGFSPWGLMSLLLTFLSFGLPAVRRCLGLIANATDENAKGKVKLFACALVGARLARIARIRGWEHLHVHSCANSANVALFAKVLGGLPYSITLHGPLSDYGANQEQKWKHAAFGIVITQKLFDELRAELGKDATPNLLIAPMGVNVDRFKRENPYQVWDRKGPALIYTVGRLNPCKGHADLIQAVSLLKERGYAVRLRIAGEDEAGGSGYRRDLEALIQRLSLENEVQLLGAISEGEVRKGLEESHVFALASLHEPLGVAIMEAMALEMPVVVTSGGGVKELVTDGHDGFLVPPEYSPALAQALERVLNDSSLASRLANASRQTIIDRFQDHRSAQILLEGIAKYGIHA